MIATNVVADVPVEVASSSRRSRSSSGRPKRCRTGHESTSVVRLHYTVAHSEHFAHAACPRIPPTTETAGSPQTERRHPALPGIETADSDPSGHCITLGVARLTSPGRRDQLPPTTSDTMEARGCGARMGARPTSAPAGSAPPAAEWTRVTVRDSSGRSGATAGEPLGQLRLARAGRTDHQEMVWARSRDLDGAPTERLAAHVGEVWYRAGVFLGRSRRHRIPPPLQPGGAAPIARSCSANPPRRDADH